MSDTTTPIKFGPAQLMSHTPKWAKAIIVSLISALVLIDGLVKAVPAFATLIPANILQWINLSGLVVAFICQQFGLKNPFLTTPDSKDVPLDTAGVDLTIKKDA